MDTMNAWGGAGVELLFYTRYVDNALSQQDTAPALAWLIPSALSCAK